MAITDSSPASGRMSITLDARAFIDHVERGDEAVGALLAAAEAGTLDLAITTRSLGDEARPATGERLRELVEQGALSELGAPARGSARVGATSTDATHLEGRVRQVLTRRGAGEPPPRFNRLCHPSHLARHLLARRDVFMTRERAFLRRRDAAWQLLGATIKTPEEVAAALEARPNVAAERAQGAVDAEGTQSA